MVGWLASLASPELGTAQPQLVYLFFKSPVWDHYNCSRKYPIIPTIYNLSLFKFISLRIFREDQNVVCAPTDVPSYTDCKVHKTCLA